MGRLQQNSNRQKAYGNTSERIIEERRKKNVTTGTEWKLQHTSWEAAAGDVWLSAAPPPAPRTTPHHGRASASLGQPNLRQGLGTVARKTHCHAPTTPPFFKTALGLFILFCLDLNRNTRDITQTTSVRMGGRTGDWTRQAYEWLALAGVERMKAMTCNYDK